MNNILMPHNAIYMKSLSSNSRLVLSALLSLRAMPNQNFFSNERISEMLNISMPTIKRVYSELTRAGFIQRIRRSKGRTRITIVNELAVLQRLRSDMGEKNFWAMLGSRKKDIYEKFPEFNNPLVPSETNIERNHAGAVDVNKVFSEFLVNTLNASTNSFPDSKPLISSIEDLV